MTHHCFQHPTLANLNTVLPKQQIFAYDASDSMNTLRHLRDELPVYAGQVRNLPRLGVASLNWCASFLECTKQVACRLYCSLWTLGKWVDTLRTWLDETSSNPLRSLSIEKKSRCLANVGGGITKRACETPHDNSFRNYRQPTPWKNVCWWEPLRGAEPSQYPRISERKTI